jgi:ABC-type uncharacterized transport system permease subunit
VTSEVGGSRRRWRCVSPAADPGFLQRYGATIEYILIPGAALIGALGVFGIFVCAVRQEPARSLFLHVPGRVRHLVLLAEHADRAAPLILTALCTALPAQLGMVIIGGEGALLIGALSRPRRRCRCNRRAAAWWCNWRWSCAGMAGGGSGSCSPAACAISRRQRNDLEPAAGLYRARDEPSGRRPMRDPPASTSRRPARSARQHDRQDPRHRRALGLVFGIIAAIASYILIYHTVFGFAARIAGGNIRAAKIVRPAVGKLIVTICFLAGAAPGSPAWSRSPRCRAAPTPTLAAGYGFTGILVAFLARHNPLAIIPVAILLGGISASGGLIQRRHGPARRLGAGAAGHHLRRRAGERRAVRPLRLLKGKS